MKIQKLVYYTHGYYLALNDGEPLIDELFEAWKFGPVLPSLYYEFRECRAGGIDFLARDPDTNRVAETPEEEDVEELVDFVWEKYGQLSAMGLSKRTHRADGPWARVVEENDGRILRNVDIPNRYIKEYFDRLIER